MISLRLGNTMPATQNPDDLPVRDRSVVVALVALVHVVALWSYVSASGQPKSAPREFSVSVAFTAPAQADPKPVVKQRAISKRQPLPELEPSDVPDEPAPSPQAESAPAQPENASPAPADRDPDYQASYLANPLPAYPMIARRMGWQGKVILNVEVLESGYPGQIRIHQSSGREVLDNAAMQAVRGWKFVPARRNGLVITKWFLVPIPFILKEAE